MMGLFRNSVFLRWVLLADAVTCIATGLLLMIGADFLMEFLGMPKTLLRYAGLSLIPFAVLLIYLASRERLPQSVIFGVIVYNLLWTLDSFLLLLSGWIEPTTFGYAFVIAQAFGVAMFAAIEYIGLQKSLTTATQ